MSVIYSPGIILHFKEQYELGKIYVQKHYGYLWKSKVKPEPLGLVDKVDGVAAKPPVAADADHDNKNVGSSLAIDKDSDEAVVLR